MLLKLEHWFLEAGGVEDICKQCFSSAPNTVSKAKKQVKNRKKTNGNPPKNRTKKEHQTSKKKIKQKQNKHPNSFPQLKRKGTKSIALYIHFGFKQFSGII